MKPSKITRKKRKTDKEIKILSKIYLQIYGVHHLNPRGNFHFLWIGDFCIFWEPIFSGWRSLKFFQKSYVICFSNSRTSIRKGKYNFFYLTGCTKGSFIQGNGDLVHRVQQIAANNPGQETQTTAATFGSCYSIP